ncbi:hypothetical protein [Halotia branconii]|uniref:Uncharacterized protein n=1 Tax=Halotia branconii CENA392 TaxID=1539056 RepID=A0AAJ6NZA1_9CYAN|nr:hypothetical protein [Halotia branconii]WGV29193.1 hypothetical protein QI031_30800 [Halotia branconii CENA392]
MIQDFRLQPNISIWHDGESFKAQVCWDNTDTSKPELSAITETHLAAIIANVIQTYIVEEIEYNLFVN